MNKRILPFLTVSFLPAALAMCLVGACGGLNRNLYNTENVAVDAVRGAGHTLNLWYTNQQQQITANTNTAQAAQQLASLSNSVAAIHGDIRNFGVGVQTVDQLRLAYATNAASTNLTAFQAALNAIVSQSGSIVSAIQTVMGGTPQFSALPPPGKSP